MLQNEARSTRGYRGLVSLRPRSGIRYLLGGASGPLPGAGGVLPAQPHTRVGGAAPGVGGAVLGRREGWGRAGTTAVKLRQAGWWKKSWVGLGKLRQERKAKLVLSTVMSDLSDMEL